MAGTDVITPPQNSVQSFAVMLQNICTTNAAVPVLLEVQLFLKDAEVKRRILSEIPILKVCLQRSEGLTSKQGFWSEDLNSHKITYNFLNTLQAIY